MIPYTLNEGGVTFFYRGRQRVISVDHPHFNHIIEAIIRGDTQDLDNFVDIRKFVIKATSGEVSICSDDVVRFKGTPVPEYLAMRIIMHYNNGYPIEPLCNFAEKLMSNPTPDVREDLYKWLENGNMPIFPDGDFAAYKLVRDDFSPIHTGPYGHDQSPGTTVEMPRHLCDDNRNSTCSTGLHFCSYEYLPKFQEWNNNLGQRVILLKINPADVVAIPTDYNLSKGRTCKFYVIEEINPEDIKDDFAGTLVLNRYDTLVDDIDDETWEDDYSDSNPNVKDEYEYALNYEDVNDSYNQFTRKFGGVTIEDVEKAITDNDGNKTAAARDLDISRSTLYKILKKYQPANPPQTNKDRAHLALEAHGGNKTRAAASLGIARSTLSRWLYK